MRIPDQSIGVGLQAIIPPAPAARNRYPLPELSDLGPASPGQACLGTLPPFGRSPNSRSPDSRVPPNPDIPPGADSPGMTSLEYAWWCRAIRLCNNPAGLYRLRDLLDRTHGNHPDTHGLRFILTTKRVRLLEAG